jgi:hypothetical protein
MDNAGFVIMITLFLNLGSLIGLIVWASQDDIYTLTSIYEFYWFVSIFSLLTGLLGLFLHLKPDVIKNTQFEHYKLYIITFYSILMSVFWLAAAASISKLCRDCLYIKNKYYSIVDYYYSKNKFTCDGEILSTTFGIFLVILWLIIFLFVSKQLYEHIKLQELQEFQESQELQESRYNIKEEVELENTNTNTNVHKDNYNNNEIEISGRPAFDEPR